ncbi:MAG TPA: recombination-associated protein RdgC [Geobacteraceae bacterium]|nr:recombination-associated protein RdgC [Geobacteraceae bacterium]
MGMLSNTVSICQFLVVGDTPAGDLFSWASENLSRHGFQPIDQGTAELSVGWVHSGNHRESSFAAPADFWHDHYLAFSLRQDRRRLPAALLKAYLQVEEQEFLLANPGLRRVPKQKREELRDKVRTQLLARTLPVPTVYDAVWDSRTGLLTFASLAGTAVEAFETEFKKTFPGLRLVAVHPFARAEKVVDSPLQGALRTFNRATSEAVLDLMQSNRWLGWDFLLWLMYRTMNGSSEYRVSRPGPSGEGEPFVAYLNDRLVLASNGEAGQQKITVAGPQDRFSEVRTALENGKVINEAAIHLEKGEHLWKMTLKGEPFHFASYKAPRVQAEKDATVDEASEQEALFYERMYVLETGLQLFDSLFAAFLAVRLGSGWEGEMGAINAWLAAE